jgi:ribonuclease HII
MLSCFCENKDQFEIGIDEAGRGPLFGRLYVASVVLPKNNSFRHEDMKDSKKFHSKNKIQKVAEYIKMNAIAWSIQYVESETIDEINIRQAVFKGMHESIREIIPIIGSNIEKNNIMLLVDGNDFKPFTYYDKDAEEIRSLRHETIEKGDNKYTCIAAASILAKVARDKYITELCEKNPELSEKYGINTNMGYGTKTHMDGIKKYGITEWHRKSFAPCRGTYGSPCDPLP